MSVLSDVWGWFTTSEHWQGDNGVVHRMWEHIELSAISVAVAFVIAVPIGVLLGHWRRGGTVAVSVANLGRAMPSFAVLVIVVQVSGIGAFPTFVALLLLAIPPMLVNSYVGMRNVDDDLREAARGMGMTGWQSLRRVELPSASPLVIAGVRTATVQVIATATLAALVAWGGLGRYVVDGIATQDDAQMIAGSILVITLAMLAELMFSGIERLVVPRGIRERGSVPRIARGKATVVGPGVLSEIES